jgi:hypothetical protein
LTALWFRESTLQNLSTGWSFTYFDAKILFRIHFGTPPELILSLARRRAFTARRARLKITSGCVHVAYGP